MSKLWTGRTSGKTSKIADEFNSSIPVDYVMFEQDIAGSVSHAKMLERQGIIGSADSKKIIDGLLSILEDIKSGALSIDMSAEDIHMFIEAELTGRIGDAGKMVHTARSRNDQVALDFRMYVMKESEEISGKLKGLVKVLCSIAEENTQTIMPGYTHLQRAQPVSFAQHMLAYCMMLLRDIGRLKDCKKRTNVCPIGACALAGTSFEIDRDFEAKELGFDSVCMNSMDAVSDRDFALELLSSLSIIMMHLSRLSEELVLWSSSEFKFIELSDAFTTGSSIMPQKKNPDMAELCRGKCGRVYGSLVALLTTMKGLPLAYNKDMQEDKEGVFDAIETVKSCLDVFTPMLEEMKVQPKNMKLAAAKGFINATDAADYLTAKGMPFGDAYKISGGLVAYALEHDETLESLSLDVYRSFSELFEEDIYEAVDLLNCMAKRNSKGGTAPESVKEEIEFVKSNV